MKKNDVNEKIEQIEQIEIIIWAFEHGYNLAKHDMKEGIHIDFGEIRKKFLQDLIEMVNRDKHL